MIYKFKRHKIEVYDSVHNLPILRFQKFNKYQMEASEIGNTFQDYENRTTKIIQFAQKNMQKELLQELENRRLTVYNAYNNYSSSLRAFAVLIKSINGKEYTDFSPEGLKEVIDHLDRIGLSNQELMSKLKEVKKKVESELSVYYPKFFSKKDGDTVKSLVVKRCHLMLDEIINKDLGINKEKIFETEKEILEHVKPKIWNVHQQDNMERKLEVDFHVFALMVIKDSSMVLDNVSTFSFYAKAEQMYLMSSKK